LNAWLPELKSQPRLCVSPEFAARPLVGVTENIARKSALVSPFAGPVTFVTATVVEMLSLVSTSVTVNVPLVDRPPFVSGNAAEAVSPAIARMSGWSLVPVMVTVTF